MNRLSQVVALLLLGLLLSGIALLLPLQSSRGERALFRAAERWRQAGPFSLGSPPLAPALALLFDSLQPGPPLSQQAPWRLPYELVARLGGPGEAMLLHFPWRLRFLGVLLGLLAALAVLRATCYLRPRGDPLAFLSAACVLLLPGFALVFATPSTLLPAAFLGTLAGVLLLPEGITAKRALLAGGLLGGAVAADPSAWLLVAGCLSLLLLDQGSRSRRLGRAAWLLGPPLVLFLAWAALRGGAPGGPALYVAHALPEGARALAPPAGLLLTRLGLAFRGFLGVADGGFVTAGELFMVLAASILPLTILMALLLWRRSGGSPRERQVAGFFLVALLTGVGLVLWRSFERTDQEIRIFSLLTLPVAAVWALGAPLLFGRHALRLLKGLVLLSAAGGLLFLHGSLLPRYHAALAAEDVPGGVFYLDCGSLASKKFLDKGQLQPWLGLSRPDAQKRMVTGPPGTKPTIVLRLQHLLPGRDHLCSVRIRPPVPGFRLSTLTHVRFLVRGHPISGLLSSHGRTGQWIHMALPRRQGADGSLELQVEGMGELIGLSEVLVRRVPYVLKEVAFEHEHVRVRLAADGASRWGHFSLLVCSEPTGRLAGPALPIPSGSWKSQTFTLPLLPHPSGKLEVFLSLPPVVAVDQKAVLMVDPTALDQGVLQPARDLGGAVASPGCLVLDLDPDLQGKKSVLRLRGVPKGSRALAFLGPQGETLSGFHVAGVEGPEGLQDLLRQGISWQGPGRPVIFSGSRVLRLDRILVWRSPRWSLTFKEGQ